MKVLKHSYLAFAVPLSLFLFSYFLAICKFSPSNELTIAITLDFIFTAPLVYYLFIRTTKIPNYTAFSLFVFATFLASYILPEGHQSLISNIKFYLIPIVEVGILSVVFYHFYQISKRFRSQSDIESDFFDTIRYACSKSLPAPISNLLATEIAVFYYAFNCCKRRSLKEHEFSYHKKSGSALVLSTFIGILLVETFALHIVLANWNNTIAWLLSILSFYTCLQILAIIRSLSHRPASIDRSDWTLNLKYGFFAEATIPIDEIERIEETARSLPKDMEMVKFSPIENMDNHNLILFLKKPCLVKSVYGKNKSVTTLAIYIDKKEAFLNMINQLS